MPNNHIMHLLNLEDVNIRKVKHEDNYVRIIIETDDTTQICPCCHQQTKQIHDYRYQKIKDLPIQFKECYLVLRKRRYRCKFGNRFYEKYPF